MEDIDHEEMVRFDFADLLISSTRYYIGRKTYAVGPHARKLAAAWPHLPEHARTTIRRDLERAFKRDNKLREMGEEKGLPLGWDCDRIEWEKVREAWQEMEADNE